MQEGKWITLKDGRHILLKPKPIVMNDTNVYVNNMLRGAIKPTNEKDELQNVFDQIEDEMIHQDKHSYDIKSNDTDEMMFFIDEVVKPIVNASNLDDNKKKEVIGYMIMDINDNKRWSIKTGVKTMKDWYKLK